MHASPNAYCAHGEPCSISQANVKKKLDDFLQEFQEGKQQGSVISNQTTDSLSLDEKKSGIPFEKNSRTLV
jgi:hypothetical protein